MWRVLGILVLGFIAIRMLSRFIAGFTAAPSQKKQDVKMEYDPRTTRSRIPKDVGEEIDFEEIEN